MTTPPVFNRTLHSYCSWQSASFVILMGRHISAPTDVQISGCRHGTNAVQVAVGSSARSGGNYNRMQERRVKLTTPPWFTRTLHSYCWWRSASFVILMGRHISAPTDVQISGCHHDIKAKQVRSG